MKILAISLSLLAATLFVSRNASAAEPDADLAELRARIEALELQNESLRQTLLGLQSAQDRPVLGDEGSGVSGSERSAVESRFYELESHLAENTPPCCPEDTPAKGELGMTATWHHGLELATENKDFRVHVGGMYQADGGWFAAPDNVQDNINFPYSDGADLRRARLRVDGTMYHSIEWVFEFDFVNAFRVDGVDRGIPAPASVYATYTEVPWVGNVRVGNQKPAIGMEHLASARFLPFMERSFNQDTFYGGRFNGYWPGISLFDTYGPCENGTWNVGAFRPTDNVFAEATHDGDYAVVGRMTWLPWYECQGAELLHFGVSAMQHTTVNDRILFRTRDAVRTGLASGWPIPATTGDVFGEDMQWLNGEIAAMHGPWTFQSEYLVSYLHEAAPIVANVVQPGVGTVSYHGGYAQLLVFLTGEHDNYNKKNGFFDRVIPRENFYFRGGHVGGGPGAWQLGARYNFLDLNDNGLDGGILHNATLGLNWFLNPNMKVQFNYMATHRDAPLAGELGDGWIHGWGIRLAHDF
jgi:phosphate-selective porin OprO and OprP